MEISQNFVAFSEYMNFKRKWQSKAELLQVGIFSALNSFSREILIIVQKLEDHYIKSVLKNILVLVNSIFY